MKKKTVKSTPDKKRIIMMLMMINRVNNKFYGISTDLFDEIHLFTNFFGRQEKRERNSNRVYVWNERYRLLWIYFIHTKALVEDTVKHKYEVERKKSYANF